MSSSLSRAQVLRQHRRHDEAVAMLHEHLASFPDDAVAHLELALNRIEIPGQKALALEDARRATGLRPNDAFPLALQANILSQLDREKEALPLAEAAIALDPEDVYAWNAKTLALCGLHRWNDAEQSARHARELDADDEAASNLMAHVLRLQKKLDESQAESRRRLARDPDNAFSFANAGWAALQRRQVQEAENYFKEALRLRPDLKYAREGLKESYRARSGFYRLFLRWAFFMQRFSEKHRTMIFIGLIVGVRIMGALAKLVHPALAVLLIVAYYIFLFGTWIAPGIANFLILKDPIARMSLDRGEKVEGVAIGTLFLGGMLILITGLVLDQLPLAVAGGTMMAVAIPASMIFTNESRLGQLVFGVCTALALTLGGITVYRMTTPPQGDADFSFLVLVFGIVAACTWLSRVPALRRVKPS